MEFARVVKRINVPDSIRVERVIHDLDSIDTIVNPAYLLEVCRKLWTQAIQETNELPDFLLGLDNGGFIPTLGLSILSGIPYKLAFKLDLDVEPKVRIIEPFAVGKDVFVYNLESGNKIFLIDDEIYTGETLYDAIKTLKTYDISVIAAICLVENTRHNARAKLSSLNVRLFSFTTIDA
jgi:adenine phosphoribosyltransferase